MRLKSGPGRAAARACAAAAFALLCLSHARAQEQPLTPPKVEVKVTAGGAAFEDENGHAVVGGALRVYLSRRWSFEPELLYMRNGPSDQDYIFTAGVAYDFVEPTRKVVPYAVAGVGVERHTGTFVGFDFETGAPVTFDTAYTTWTAGVGAGVKLFVTDCLYVAPEARIGREPHVRATVSVGYVLSGRSRR